MLIGNYTWQNKKVSFLYVALKNLRNILFLLTLWQILAPSWYHEIFYVMKQNIYFFRQIDIYFFLVKDRYMMRSDSKKKCVVNNIPLKKIQNANDGNIVYCCMSNLLRSFSCNGLCYCCWNFSVFFHFQIPEGDFMGAPS